MTLMLYIMHTPTSILQKVHNMFSINLDPAEWFERPVYGRQSREESVRGLGSADRRPITTAISRLVSTSNALDSTLRLPLHSYTQTCNNPSATDREEFNVRLHTFQRGVIKWVRFNVPPKTLQVISGTGFYGSNDPTSSVKVLKEDRILRIRLQSHQVHHTVFTLNRLQWCDEAGRNSHLYHPIVWYKYKSLRMWFIIPYYHKIFTFAVLQGWLTYDCGTKCSFILFNICGFIA